MLVKAVLLACCLVLGASAMEITTGEIGGANYMVAKPADWSGKLVLLAHGYRSEGQPLKADFEVDPKFARPLLDEGWAIASTSYRRNGWIIGDAILDLKALRDHVAATGGEIRRCIIVGSSMGGLIGTLAAEGAIENIHGVVAIGAYLGDRVTDGYHPDLTRTPKVPVLFLTNETELEHPRHYLSKSVDGNTALWEIRRPGHCNVSGAERLQAVLAVDAWIDGTAPEKEKDATVPPPARESTALKEDGRLTGEVTFVSAGFGNFSSDFVAADLEALELGIGDKAILKSSSATIEATVARYYSDVGQGKTSVYVTPEGWLAIVTNGGNAAEALGVKTGDRVSISPVSESTQEDPPPR